MGADKAFLELEGSSLLARALDLAKTVSEQVAIVGDPAKLAAFAPVVPDVYADRGPLGGIHAALASSQAELNLILGVDLPFLNTSFLTYLVAQAESSGAIVSVPFAARGYQPLCSVFRKQFAETANAALLQGKNKIDAIFPEVSLRVIDEAELRREGFDVQLFRNVNTPEDWEEAQRELTSRTQHL